MKIKSSGNWFINSKHALDFLSNAETRTRKAEFWGMEFELPGMQILDSGIAVIPVHGLLAKRPDGFEKLVFGVTDFDDVRRDLQEADDRYDVEMIVLDFDTPGGSATGTRELADDISGIPKPVYAYTDTIMCSAGYYAACAANHICASPSATVGCVGTVMSHYDVSKMFEDMGIKVELFASGKFKGMGSPGVPLTDEQREFLQASVDEDANTFKDYVRANRGGWVPEEDMEGQWFTGEHALKNGMVDENINSLAEFLKWIS